MPNSTRQPSGFSARELEQLGEVDRRLESAYQAQEAARSRLSMLYAQLSTLNPFPKGGLLARGVRFLLRPFGLAKSDRGSPQASLQNDISQRVRTVREIHSRFIRQEEQEVRQQFRGRTFLADEGTPKVLTQVAVPEGKSFVPFKRLRSAIAHRMGDLGPRIQVKCPSDERIIIYRQRPNDSWESLELSWRRPGKVDVVRNGVTLGNLFNDDAFRAASAFAQGKRFSLKEMTPTRDTVWKVA